MQKITSIINNQQGSVIIMAVIVLALLTVIGIAATNTSTTEVQVSTNAVLHNIAFYTADSGIAAGRAALNNIKIADSGNWDLLLRNMATDPPGTEKINWNGVDCTTLDEIIDAEGGRTVGLATFHLEIEDNIDLDNDLEMDTDDTVFLTSTTLVSPSSRNATARIRTMVRGGGVAYAQEHYNAGSSGDASAGSDAADATKRW
jgi:hypothetical protein